MAEMFTGPVDGASKDASELDLKPSCGGPASVGALRLPDGPASGRTSEVRGALDGAPREPRFCPHADDSDSAASEARMATVARDLRRISATSRVAGVRGHRFGRAIGRGV